MSLEEIGQKLKSARDGSGLSLSQIQEKTKIPFSHLSAIDSGNFDDLPEPVYVSGFIKRYAECVGLDGQELADEYRTEIEGPSTKPQKGFGLRVPKRNNGNNAPPATYYSRPPIEHSAPNLIKLIPFYALWIILILGLIIYLVNRQGAIDLSQQDSALLTLKQSTAGVNPGKNNSGQNNQAGNDSADKQSDTVSSGQETSSDNDTSHIILKAKNHVWVEVKAISSGEALFNGFMEAGDSHDFSDKEGFRIRAGNGGNVLITSAGKTEPFGLAGKITEKTFASGKANQVAESQTSTVSQSTESAPSTVHKKATPDGVSAQIKKPTADSITTVAPTKKPAIASTNKAHPSHDNTAHENGEGGDNNSQNGKGIDVPYRYSE